MKPISSHVAAPRLVPKFLSMLLVALASCVGLAGCGMEEKT